MPSFVLFRCQIAAVALVLLGHAASAEVVSIPAEIVQSEPVVAAAVLSDQVIAETYGAVPLPLLDNRALDQVWMVSSRRLGSKNCGIESLDVRQRIGNAWHASSTSGFFAPEPDGIQRPIVIFIHGNRWSLDKAILRGMQTYQQTIMPWKEAPPMRFVVWTWPADQVAGPIRDVRIKADRADEHAFHLARFLQHVDPQTPVSILGFSFGGRVALGAMQLIGGGPLDGCCLPPAAHPISPINLTLAVPAIRNDCLTSTHRNAYSQINHLDLVYNSRDAYLNLYRFTRFDNRMPAMGYTGIRGLNRLPDYESRVHQFNAARFVGVQHDYLEYITDHRIEASLRKHLLIGLPL